MYWSVWVGFQYTEEDKEWDWPVSIWASDKAIMQSTSSPRANCMVWWIELMWVVKSSTGESCRAIVLFTYRLHMVILYLNVSSVLSSNHFMHSLATIGLIGHPIATPSTFEYRTPPFVRWAFARGRVWGVWPLNSGWWAPWWIKPLHQMTPVHPPRPVSSLSTVEWGRHCSSGHTGSYPLTGPRCRPHAERLHSPANLTMGCSGFSVLWTLGKPWNWGIVIEVGYKCLYWILLRAPGSSRSFSCLTSGVVYMDLGSWSRSGGSALRSYSPFCSSQQSPSPYQLTRRFYCCRWLVMKGIAFLLRNVGFRFFEEGGGGLLENLGAIRS